MTGLSDIGGPLGGERVTVQIVRLASHGRPDEEILSSEAFEGIQLGFPVLLRKLAPLGKRHLAPLVLRFLRTAGSAVGDWDVVVSLRFKRRPGAAPPGATDPWASSTE